MDLQAIKTKSVDIIQELLSWDNSENIKEVLTEMFNAYFVQEDISDKEGRSRILTFYQILNEALTSMGELDPRTNKEAGMALQGWTMGKYANVSEPPKNEMPNITEESEYIKSLKKSFTELLTDESRGTTNSFELFGEKYKAANILFKNRMVHLD